MSFLALKLQYLFIGAVMGFIIGHSLGGGLLNSAAEKRQMREMVRQMQQELQDSARLYKEHVAQLRSEGAEQVERHEELQEEHNTLQQRHADEVGKRMAQEEALREALHQHKVHSDLHDPEGGDGRRRKSPDTQHGGGSDDDSDSDSGEEESGSGASQEEAEEADVRKRRSGGAAKKSGKKAVKRAVEERDEGGSSQESAEEEGGGGEGGEDTVPDTYDISSFELPKLRAKGNRLIVIPANLGYIQFALNLVCSLRRLKITNYVLLAMDKGVLAEFKKRKLPVYTDPDLPYVTSKSAEWAEANFHKLVCTKLVPVTNLLKLGINILLTDADIVWRHDPFPYVREELSLTYSIGSCHKSLEDNLDLSRHKIAKLNTGFYYAHAQPEVISLFERAYQICKTGSLTGDQPAINTAIHQDVASGHVPYTYGFFSGCLFANGCVYFKRLCGNTSAYDPVVVHANFVVGRRKKIRSLAKNGLWDLTCHPNPDEYKLPEPEKKDKDKPSKGNKGKGKSH